MTMPSLEELQKGLWGKKVPDTLRVQIRRPRLIPEADDSLEFHAARLLLLLYHSRGRVKKIESRTKVAKMDFLVRYPTYLVEAARIKRVPTNIKTTARPESRMIRYKYGPWDTKYYDVFAYLVAKGFVEIEPSKSKGDIFNLTEKGNLAAEELAGPEFEEITERCILVHKLFGDVSGTTIKDFIYRYFTEVIDRPLGEQIEGDDAA
jgi:hypothetical protein